MEVGSDDGDSDNLEVGSVDRNNNGLDDRSSDVTKDGSEEGDSDVIDVGLENKGIKDGDNNDDIDGTEGRSAYTDGSKVDFVD